MLEVVGDLLPAGELFSNHCLKYRKSLPLVIWKKSLSKLILLGLRDRKSSLAKNRNKLLKIWYKIFAKLVYTPICRI
jgi:hypothetical protein